MHRLDHARDELVEALARIGHLPHHEAHRLRLTRGMHEHRLHRRHDAALDRPRGGRQHVERGQVGTHLRLETLDHRGPQLGLGAEVVRHHRHVAARVRRDRA